MNKKVLFGMFGLAAGGLMASENAVATFNPYAALNVGGSYLLKKNDLKYKLGGCGSVEFGVTYDAWRLGMEVSYSQNKIKEGTNAQMRAFARDYNKVNALSGMVNVYYDYALTDEFSLYLGVGLGASKVNYVDANTKVEMGKTVFAWQAKFGVAYDINENWTIQVGYRVSGTSKLKVSYNGQTDKVRTPIRNTFEGGIRYNF